MTYLIRLLQNCNRRELVTKFQRAMSQSNFDVYEYGIYDPTRSYPGGKLSLLRIRNVWNRIEQDRNDNILNHLDWIKFNDLVNDILDKEMILANVSSSTHIVRKGSNRRNFYSYNSFGWYYDEHMDMKAYHNGMGAISFRSRYRHLK